jgi:hypothetical protein
MPAEMAGWSKFA